MKKPSLSRKQILCAIQAACLAAFLSSAVARAQFKYDTQLPADVVTVASPAGSTNTVAARGTFSGSFTDTGAGTDNVTVNSGAAISGGTSMIKFASGGTLTNLGKLTQSAAANGVTLVPADLSTATTPLTVANSGTITTPESQSYYDYAIGLRAQATSSAPVSVTNASAGKFNISGEFQADALVASGSGGAVSVENDGSITSSGVFATPTGMNASNTGGNISLTNTGTVSINGFSGIGISSNISGSGSTTINNSGTAGATSSSVYGGTTGLNASSSSGDISVTNSGSLSASGYATQGLAAHSGGALTLVNTGTITGGGSFTGGEVGGGLGEGVDATAAGNISITNQQAINASASGYYCSTSGVTANSTSGSVYINNTGTVGTSNDVNAAGTSSGILAQTAGAAITILNSASVGSGNDGGSNYGIDAQTTGTTSASAAATITNSGTISVNGGYDNVDGIAVNSPLLTASITNSSAGKISANGLPGDGTCAVYVSQTTGADVITNAGTINSNGGGIQDSGTGKVTVNLQGGTLSAGGGYPAVQLGTGTNTVNISSSAVVTGLINGGSGSAANILRFIGLTATAAQKAQFKTTAAQAAANPAGTYSVTLGSSTYQFTNFKIVTAKPH